MVPHEAALGIARKECLNTARTSLVSQVPTRGPPGISVHSVSRPGWTVMTGATRMYGLALPVFMLASSMSPPCMALNQVVGDPGKPGNNSITGNFVFLYCGKVYCGGSQTRIIEWIPEAGPVTVAP